MKRLIALLAAITLTCGLTFAQKFTISGYITDAASGEPLIGAAVIDQSSSQGVVTGNTGFFSISLEKGTRQLVFSYIGYIDKALEVELDRNMSMNITLSQTEEQLSAAVVTAHRKITGARSTQMSAVEVPITQIKAMPAIAGEVDVIKTLQLLPGVQSGSEGTAGLYVRGGGADENLLLMDGVPLYNVNHLLGFFSVFNADAVKNVTLYKGSFPARFGGHLSSVIDVRLNDGNDSEYHGNFSVGAISSKFNLEGPIVKGKTTFNISARRTYLDLLIKPALWYEGMISNEDKDNYSRTNGGYDFYDLNTKITHKFNNGDRLSLSFYMGDDNANVSMDDGSYYELEDYDYEKDELIKTGIYLKSKDKVKLGWRWGNLVASLRYNHELTPKLYMSAATNVTRYRSFLSVGLYEYYSQTQNNVESNKSESEAGMSYNSLIGDISATADFDWRPALEHDIKFGGAYTYHTFTPGVIAMMMKATSDAGAGMDYSEQIGDKPIYSHEASLFFEDNWSILPWLKANLGMHTSLYAVNNKTYLSAEPRLSARALLSDEISAKLSYCEMSQYIHMLCNSNLSLPSDLWVPVTKNIEPMRSRQVAAGLFWDKGGFEYSIEAYYKGMDNVLEYKDGASYFSTSTGWEDKVCMGQGWAYGVELLAQKKLGKTTGWIGYTWSKAMRKFDKPGMEINAGKPFPAKYDRTHDLSIAIAHEFTKNFDVSATFILASGNRGTLASDYIAGGTIGEGGSTADFWTQFDQISYVYERNNYRMPLYNRMDVGMNLKRPKKHGTAIWNLSIYNVYNRLNPYMIMPDTHYEYDENDNVVATWPVLTQVSIFPFMPSFSYTYKF